MAIRYSFAVAEDTLFVETSGFDESVEEVQAYSLAVIDACVANGVSRVLCDERALEYRLGTFDTHELAIFAREHAPQVCNVAVVCSARFLADAEFWQQTASNRGLSVRVFTRLDPARQWLGL